MKALASIALTSLVVCSSLTYAVGDAASAPLSTPASSEMTSGEVRKIDMDTRKITLKHGEIKNLGMPGMTMVFQVKEPAMLEAVKSGDKVRFTAEKMNGAMTITNIKVAD